MSLGEFKYWEKEREAGCWEDKRRIRGDDMADIEVDQTLTSAIDVHRCSW
jgi:hypothetical protein